jgi:hypothetical protein
MTTTKTATPHDPYPEYPAPRPIPAGMALLLAVLSWVLVIGCLLLAAYMAFILPGQVANAAVEPLRVYPAPPPWQPMACIITKAGC